MSASATQIPQSLALGIAAGISIGIGYFVFSDWKPESSRGKQHGVEVSREASGSDKISVEATSRSDSEHIKEEESASDDDDYYFNACKCT